MKKVLMMIVMLVAGFVAAEQKELTGTFRAQVGKTASIKTEEGKYIRLGMYDGKTVKFPGGEKDVSAFAIGDPIKVVVEGTPMENNGFRVEKLISIEKQ